MNFDSYHLTLIIVALITGFISPLTLQLIQFFLKRNKGNLKHTLDQNDAIKNDELITSKLRTLMEQYHCDRVWIAEFHNGGKTYSGKSFQRFSTTYEVVAKGVGPEAVNTQNIPTSIFSIFFTKLANDYYFYTPDIKKTNDPMSFAMQSFWENRGVSGFICFAIKDISNNFVGFLCMDGVIKNVQIEQSMIQKLIMETSNLAGYLEE